jgi:hypothetical protein
MSRDELFAACKAQQPSSPDSMQASYALGPGTSPNATQGHGFGLYFLAAPTNTAPHQSYVRELRRLIGFGSFTRLAL